METGYDIIFFWVARMMMLGIQLMGDAPFETVYLHGLVKDPYGQRMSKTKGNVVDPLDAISTAGADALRFALIHGTSPGNDQKFRPERLEDARNFANKLWNAGRFVLGARPDDVPHDAPLALPADTELGPAEHWILARCVATTESAERAYAEFQFGEATRLLYDAIWSEYCDWYLELAKVQLAQPARRAATWQVLVWVLDRYLRLLHPVMPHITEEMWSRLPHAATDGELLIVAGWPAPTDAPSSADPAIAAAVESLIELIGDIRAARAESGIAAGATLDARIWLADEQLRVAFAGLRPAIGRLARIEAVLVGDRTELEAGAAMELAVVSAAGDARLARSGADVERERERLARELERARGQLAQADKLLADTNFTRRAPPAVVQQARARAAELRQRVARLSESSRA
jgi:valyl-tRNA synthetase